MIKLKNVSKFYYSKGVIASGFTKVNLEFNIGEFVAITGESGSGKSTLLNVISGLDSYEEGEMYIHGEETSHYSEKDFENYRRKYIGNIFQNFNLVNSYSVYQNIELVLLLNGAKKKEIKQKVLELIKRVDLYRFRNTKVSKLSGGQKQRVAIARALAKDTPIIIADEPTGNLDSQSAKGIIKLLSEIAKDKLVVIVTHNYEQVEKYVTRKIKMHDGKVLEDKIIKKTDSIYEGKELNYQNITFLNKLRLGVRNTFNIVPKFLLLFFVYLFITIALMSEYSSFKKEEAESSKEGYNYVFSNVSDKRIIINKKDRSSFTEDDYEKIKNIDHVFRIENIDLILDTHLNLGNDETFYFWGTIASLSSFKEEVDYGRLPQEDTEIILVGNKNDYHLGDMREELLNTELYLSDIYSGELNKNAKVKVVGIKYHKQENNYDTVIYLGDALLENIKFQINQQYSKVNILFMNNYYESNVYSNLFKIISNSRVPKGKVYVSNDLSWSCKNENCINVSMKIEVNNLYYNDTLDLKISNMYNKSNMNQLLGLSDYDNYNGAIFINSEDYDSLFNKASYQSSVFADDFNNVDEVVEELNSAGYNPLAMKNTLVPYNEYQFLRIFRTIVTVILVATLFFISYFIIKIILKSRNVYFSTVRMLGGSRKVSKQLLIIELALIANIAYLLFWLAIVFIKQGGINVSTINDMINYLTIGDYILLYLILVMMSYFASVKYAKKVFKSSVIKTLTEEA